MSKQNVDEEGMGPLQRGRGRYDNKEYDAALEAFNEVSDEFLNPRALGRRQSKRKLSLQLFLRLDPSFDNTHPEVY